MYYFIVNPKASSGRGLKSWWTVKNELDRNKIEYVVEFTRKSGHGQEIARRLTFGSDKIITIVILGGDGTLNEVVNGVTNLSKVIFGYIPAGSSNDLGRSLGISKDPLTALSHILKPKHFASLDYGIADFNNGDMPKRFICSSGAGFDANVCVEAAESTIKQFLNRWGLGKSTYLLIALKQLITSKRFDATITIDGRYTKKYKEIFLIANMIHKYEGGGLPMAPKANYNDGKFDICLVHGLTLSRALIVMVGLFFGKHINFREVKYFKCESIEIKTNQKVAFHTDGEAKDSYSNIRLECKKRMVKFIVANK